MNDNMFGLFYFSSMTGTFSDCAILNNICSPLFCCFLGEMIVKNCNIDNATICKSNGYSSVNTNDMETISFVNSLDHAKYEKCILDLNFFYNNLFKNKDGKYNCSKYPNQYLRCIIYRKSVELFIPILFSKK